jgi:Transposase
MPGLCPSGLGPTWIRRKDVRGADFGYRPGRRAAHQASLARPDGTFVWTGRKFFTRPAELDKLWADIGLGELDTVRVVMEPTRNVWAPVASWFRQRGARISMVPTTQSVDLRAYYSKHTKNDHLDSKLLARLPLLHREGLREHTGNEERILTTRRNGSAGPAVKQYVAQPFLVRARSPVECGDVSQISSWSSDGWT